MGRATGRNVVLARGINRFGRAAMRHKRGAWRHMKKPGSKSTKESNPSAAYEAQPVSVGPKSIAATHPQSAWWLSRRLAHKARVNKAVRKLAADKSTTRQSRAKNIRKKTPKPTKLRASITPGSVLILLTGAFKGKRVVFLKQLPSGLLLVTGPFKINGVPIRRVNQAFTIPTATTVDVSGVDTSGVNDETFARDSSEKEDESGEFFDEKQKKEKKVSPERKALQAKVDAGVLKAINTTPLLGKYLRARFSLSARQYPHEMKF